MKILFTNTALQDRSGSELYVKEAAEELARRGHTVAAYSKTLGEIAHLMDQQGVRTVDDLSRLPWAPDIIHGQHHLETMTALAYFPNVPAVYFCHGWRPWQETPPLHPRIVRYAAVDSATRDSAIQKYGVPPDKVQLIHNFVDLERFKERGPLPNKPARALVFSNYANKSKANFLALVRKACGKAGIPVDAIGAGTRPVERPENFLKDYDLIFAVGRSALEALATGAAVVICGVWGVGPMVTLRETEELRDRNFGVAAMYSKPDADAIYREILRYNAEDAAAVTKSLRCLIGIKTTLDKVEKVYYDAVEKYKRMHIDFADEARSFSSYLGNISSFLKQKDREFSKKEKELIRIKSSKAWKITHLFNKTK